MREDPGLDPRRIATCLDARYGLEVAFINYLPVGYDLSAAVYEVGTDAGESYFVKVRFDPRDDTGLLVSQALVDQGIENILAPLLSRDSAISSPLDGYDGYSVLVYPFVRGESAMDVGLSDAQWREFGATLRAVHASGLEHRFRDQLPIEGFSLPSADLVRRMLTVSRSTEFDNSTAANSARFWAANAERISAMLDRAEDLGKTLQFKSFEHVLCHADIHAANILVGDDGRIWLIDWDGPKIAPRERDLLFVIGSRIARRVEPREEDLFFSGYGPVKVDLDALVYYRYERIIEDLGEIGNSVFLDEIPSERERAAAAELAMSFFDPGGDIEHAENVSRYRRSSDQSRQAN
jgi:spectinomycin phosphotransferase